MEKKRNLTVLLVSTVITVGWLSAIFYIKGIYPFGSGTVIDHDLFGLDVPARFYYAYDVLHGGNLFYDFTTACGLGRNMLFELFDSTNLFLFFFKREFLINAVSILLILKFAVIAAISSFSFSRLFKKLSTPFLILITLMYTFSGYAMQYHTEIRWLDTVALFPLLILFLRNVFEEKSKLPFFVLLTYLLAVNTYMAYFIVVALIVFGGLYIFIVDGNGKRKKHIYSLGVSTAAALVAAAAPIYLFLKSVTNTMRFDMTNVVNSDAEAVINENYSNGFVSIISQSNKDDVVPLLMFIGLELAAACLLYMAYKSFNNRQLRKPVAFFGVGLIFLILQTAVAGTDLLWHGGSHVMFPYRNGYMAALFCCLIIGYFYSNKELLEGISLKNEIFNLVPIALCAISAILPLAYGNIFYSTFGEYDVLSNTLMQKSMSFPYLRFSLFTIIPLFLLQFLKYEKFKRAVAIAMVTVMIGINSYFLIGKSYEKNYTDEKIALYYNCFDIGNSGIESDALSRVNNTDLSLISNYPYMARVNALSQWTNNLSTGQMDAFFNLGFSTVYTRLLDSGGTAFSQALLGIKTSMAKRTLDSGLYDFQTLTDRGFGIYGNRFVLPSGIVLNSEIANLNYSDFENTFEYQNVIFRSIGNDGELFVRPGKTVINEKYVKSDDYAKDFIDDDELLIPSQDEVCIGKMQISIGSKATVYMKLNEEAVIGRIYINGQLLIVDDAATDFDRESNTQFPCSYNNNVLSLGTFEDETVDIKYEIVSGNNADMDIYAMNHKLLADCCNRFSSGYDYTVDADKVTLSVNSEHDGISFIPIDYEENWKCTLNGQSVSPVCVLGSFIGVEVEKGENVIVLNYSHSKDLTLFALFFIGIAAGLLLIILDRKYSCFVPKTVYVCMSVAFTVLCLAAYFILYAVPVGYKLFEFVKTLI